MQERCGAPQYTLQRTTSTRTCRSGAIRQHPQRPIPGWRFAGNRANRHERGTPEDTHDRRSICNTMALVGAVGVTQQREVVQHQNPGGNRTPTKRRQSTRQPPSGRKPAPRRIRPLLELRLRRVQRNRPRPALPPLRASSRQTEHRPGPRSTLRPVPQTTPPVAQRRAARLRPTGLLHTNRHSSLARHAAVPAGLLLRSHNICATAPDFGSCATPRKKGMHQ